MFDAHCHLDDPRMADSLSAQLQDARAAGVKGFLCAGFSPQRWMTQVQAVSGAEDVFHGFAIHPWALKGWGVPEVDQAMEKLDQGLNGGLGVLPVALGEFGLHKVKGRDEVPFAVQEYAVNAQLSLAAEGDWPIVLHCVGAHGRMLELLDQSSFKGGGMVHSFSGSIEVMREYVKRGFKISFSGLVTRAKARRCREAAVHTPDFALLVETDAPDQMPSGRTGSGNRMEWLPDVVDELAVLRGQSPQHIAKTTELNAKTLFQLDITLHSDG